MSLRSLETLQAAAVATGNGTVAQVFGCTTAAMQVTIATTATVTFEATVDGTTWAAVPATNVVTGVTATTATATGTYLANIAGFLMFRARISSWGSGAVTVTALMSEEAGGIVASPSSSESAAAGEAHIGEVGGNSTSITPTATVSTSPAYTAGDDVGGLLTLTSALRAAGHNVVLQNIHILDRANQKPTGSILVFNANPSAATITDNAAFVYSTADLLECARVPVTSADWVTFNSKAVCDLPNLGRVITAASGTTLYAVFVTDSTPTFVATTDVQLIFSFLRD